jgi:putative tryptophan/tyrosine transport system substrate-binding protein
MIGRREFITLLGSAAATAWPLGARGQQGGRMRRVAFLHALAEDDPETRARVAAFQQEFETLGWKERRNVEVVHRFASGEFVRIQAYVTELVSLAPDVIVATSTPVVVALQQATRTIPIVFALLNDPAGQGIVATLPRPGGNITGFTYIDFPLIGKWMELLKEIAPNIRRIMLLFNPQTAPYYPMFLRDFGAWGGSLASELSAMPVRDAAEIETAVMAFTGMTGAGLIASADPFVNTHRKSIMALAQQYRLPALYGFRRFVGEGALISYGPDPVDIVRRSARYVDRILKGEKPAELPVQAPVKYELAINLNTAKALGLTVPDTLLARADEVIE